MTNESDPKPFSTGGAFDILSEVGLPDTDSFIGRDLGDYRITGLIAEGGMGRVYRAQRTDGSFDREVAVKISPASRVSRDLRQRFLREQQILASMSHASVTRLYDAGTTDEGWSYIIMELIEGQDIASFVDDRDLSGGQIIELVLPLLDAIAFAHSRLIVHRDIKAANVIVDHEGRARLLDFGIAKLQEESADDMTSARPLTLASASPEQILGEPVTTASDIYQVGLLLHRLLLGKPALPDRSLQEAVSCAMDAKPFRLSADDRAALGNDLSAIVSCCLQPDPVQRYRDMNALRDDLENHLANRPISVRRLTPYYRIGKLLQRNPWLSAAVSLLLVTVIAGTTLYTFRINEARVAAEREAAIAEEVIAFLTDVFETSDPAESLGETVTARELLDQGAADIEAQFGDRPVIRARLQHVIAGVYREMGLLTQALPLAESAYALRREHLGPDDRRTLISGNDLAIVYERLGRYDDSIRLYTEVLSRQRETIGSDDVETLKTINNLGSVYNNAGEYEMAAEYWEEAYERRRRILGIEHPEFSSTLSNLPIAYANLGRLDRAQELFLEAVDVSERVNGDKHPGTISAIANAGSLYFNRRMYDEAAPYLEKSWRLSREVLGERNWMTLIYGLNYAELMSDRQDRTPAENEVAKAAEITEQVYVAARESLGAEHPTALNAMAQLADIRNRQGRHAEALSMLETVLNIRRERFDEDNLDLLSDRVQIAESYNGLGRHADTVTVLEDVDARLSERFGPDYPDRLEYLQILAEAHSALGERAEAERLYRESAERFAATLGADDPQARRAQAALDAFLENSDVDADST